MTENTENAAAEDTAATQPAESNDASCSSAKQDERLYTDAYVKQRIDKQRAKYDEQLAERDERIAELEKSASEATAELAELKHKQELAQWAADAAKATGVPVGVIRGATAEEMLEHAKQIKSSVSIYQPTGESGSHAQNSMTKADIMGIKDAHERHKAIEENIDLFMD